MNTIENRLNVVELSISNRRDEHNKDIKDHLVAIEEELQEIKKMVRTKAEKEAVEGLQKKVSFLEQRIKI